MNTGNHDDQPASPEPVEPTAPPAPEGGNAPARDLVAEFGVRLTDAVVALGQASGSSRVPSAARRNADLFLHLYGLGPKGPESLRKVASVHGISAERVRQVCDEIAELVLPELVAGPAHADLRQGIAAAVGVIRALTPGSDDLISAEIRKTHPAILGGPGIPSIPDTQEAKASVIVRIAETLGVRTGIGTHLWEDVVGLADVGMPNCVQSLLTHARKISSASGAVNSSMLASEFEAAKGVQLTPGAVEGILNAFFEKLPSPGWLWCPSGSNDTVARARNRIAAFGWCSVENLSPVQDTAADPDSDSADKPRTRGRKPGAEWRTVPAKRPRTRSRYYFPLPNGVLLELMKANGFVISGTEVRLPENGELAVVSMPRKGKAGVAPRLSAGKSLMVSVFQAMTSESPGGRVSQKAFVEACTTHGMSQSTVRLYLYRSSLFACRDGFCVLTP
jgi:hypothetical protein